MELTGKITGVDIQSKGYITLEVNERNNLYSDEFEKLLNREKLSIEIKQFRRKRSTDANACCWGLCTRIAEVINSSKDEVYLSMLKRYGQSILTPIRSDININGFFKYYDEEGKRGDYTYYKLYKGSSEYDTKEMSILLDGICSECKLLGIPTPDEIEKQKMIEYWEENYYE